MATGRAAEAGEIDAVAGSAGSVEDRCAIDQVCAAVCVEAGHVIVVRFAVRDDGGLGEISGEAVEAGGAAVDGSAIRRVAIVGIGISDAVSHGGAEAQRKTGIVIVGRRTAIGATAHSKRESVAAAGGHAYVFDAW